MEGQGGQWGVKGGHGRSMEVSRRSWEVNIFTAKIKDVRLHWSLENVPVEPRSAAVEQVAAPVEPVLAPVHCSGQRLQSLESSGLVFLQGPCLFS